MVEFRPVGPEFARPWVKVPKDWRRPDIPGGYTVLWDDDREYGQVVPRPTLEEVRSFYNLASYYTHDEGWNENPTRLLDRALVHLAWRSDHGREVDPAWPEFFGGRSSRVLEIGCGNGAMLALMRDQGHQVTGVEPDAAARANARSAGLEVFEGTAESLPSELANRRFDIVLFHHVLEHCLDPGLAVVRAGELLADNGYLVAETPNNACRGATAFGDCWC